MKKFIIAALLVALASPAFGGQYLGTFEWEDPNPNYPITKMTFNVDIESIGMSYATNGIGIVNMANGDIYGGLCTGTAMIEGSKIIVDNNCGGDQFTLLLESNLNGRYIIKNAVGSVKALGNAELN